MTAHVITHNNVFLQVHEFSLILILVYIYILQLHVSLIKQSYDQKRQVYIFRKCNLLQW